MYMPAKPSSVKSTLPEETLAEDAFAVKAEFTFIGIINRVLIGHADNIDIRTLRQRLFDFPDFGLLGFRHEIIRIQPDDPITARAIESVIARLCEIIGPGEMK